MTSAAAQLITMLTRRCRDVLFIIVSPSFASFRGLPVDRVVGDPLRGAAGEMLGDLPGMEAPVLDEPAPRLIAAAHRAGDIEAATRRLERGLVVDRGAPAIVGKRDAEPLQHFEVGVI